VKYQSPFGVIEIFPEVSMDDVGDAALDYADIIDAAT
jgi:hypothetical protein